MPQDKILDKNTLQTVLKPGHGGPEQISNTGGLCSKPLVRFDNPNRKAKDKWIPIPKDTLSHQKGFLECLLQDKPQNSDLLKILQPVVDYQYSWHGPVDWANWEKEHVNGKNLWKTQINFPAKDKIYPPANL